MPLARLIFEPVVAGFACLLVQARRIMPAPEVLACFSATGFGIALLRHVLSRHVLPMILILNGLVAFRLWLPARLQELINHVDAIIGGKR